MKIANFQAIILDMDGVFIDSENLMFDIFRETFEPFNIELTNEYQYKFIGQPFSRNLNDIRQDFGIDFNVDLLRQKFDDAYEKLLTTSPLSAQDGVKEIVRHAQKHKLKLGLCTTSTSHHVNVVFDKIREKTFDPKNFFDVIVTGDRVTHKKPHPEPYLTVISKLEEAAEKCLVIEDSPAGIHSAKAAGCFCVALRQPYNQHISFDTADWIIDRLDQLLSQ